MIQLTLARLAGSRCLLCLVPSYDVALASSLEQVGFSAVGQYVRLAKRLLRPIEELSPETVRPALPIS